MSITNSVRALLKICGKRQVDLLPIFGLANAQSLSNKIRGERWSASDLVSVAEFTGAKLAFILPDGERIIINNATPLGEFEGDTDSGLVPKTEKK